jgi:protein-tyrosine phosphatase
MKLLNITDKYNKIIDNLYIGNHQSAVDMDFINDNNIKLIVNCTKTYEYPIPDELQLIRLNITDFNSPENNIIITANIDKILEIIDIYLTSNEGVLVHCHMGQQRSALVVACYLMKYKDLSLKDAVKKIKQKRRFAFLPNATFMDFLEYYEIEIQEE